MARLQERAQSAADAPYAVALWPADRARRVLPEPCRMPVAPKFLGPSALRGDLPGAGPALRQSPLRAWLRVSGARRFLISSLNSGILQPRNPAHSCDKRLPGVALRSQHLASRGGQFVVPTTSLALFLRPAPLNPPAVFAPIKERIKRGDVKAQRPA